MNIRIPPSIKKGCTIAVTAPSFGCTTEPYTSRFNFAKKKFESLGYKIFAGETVFKSDGKGISTNFGLMIYLSPFVFLISLLTWGIVFKFTKISSVSGLSAMTISSIIIGTHIFPNYDHLLLGYIIISLLIIFKHKDNIIRLINGNEKSFK